MSYSSCSCFCLLDRTIQICVSCFRAVKIWFFEYNSPCGTITERLKITLQNILVYIYKAMLAALMSLFFEASFCTWCWPLDHWTLILTTGCSTWHLMAKNSLRIWELELLLSTKMAEAIRSLVTAWNWVTVQWPGSYRGFPRRVSLGTGLARVDQRSWVLMLCIRCRSWLQKTDSWVLPALL